MFTIYPLNYQCLRLMQLTVYLFFGVIQKGTPKIYCPYIPNAKKKKKRKIQLKAPMVPFWRRKWQPTPVFLPGESH